MRQFIVAGNWKMNTNYAEGLRLAEGLVKENIVDNVLVVLGLPATHLMGVSQLLGKYDKFKVAAQNCHHEKSGAYTGEISVSMIKSVGAEYVILGHSERRAYFKENDELIGKKVKAAIEGGLRPIYCCGEKLPVREAGNHIKLVAKQIKQGLFHLNTTDFKEVVIAYEPVWAIGTGVTASPAQAQEMHHEIRQMIAKKYGTEIAQQTSILYGGSVKPDNAKELFVQPDVDGGLVGGASLEVAGFLKIIRSFG